jgi:hypothetical protein
VRDHLIVLAKPKKRLEWMSPYEYEQAPNTLTVREFQADGKILVTTLCVPRRRPSASCGPCVGAAGTWWSYPALVDR